MELSLTRSIQKFRKEFLRKTYLAGEHIVLGNVIELIEKFVQKYLYQQSLMRTQQPHPTYTGSTTLTPWKQQYFQDNNVTRKQLKPDNHVTSKTILNH